MTWQTYTFLCEQRMTYPVSIALWRISNWKKMYEPVFMTGSRQYWNYMIEGEKGTRYELFLCCMQIHLDWLWYRRHWRTFQNVFWIIIVSSQPSGHPFPRRHHKMAQPVLLSIRRSKPACLKYTWISSFLSHWPSEYSIVQIKIVCCWNNYFYQVSGLY